ncbi:fibroblast growth factor-binding protein 2 [Silurus meridionalis]|nr:fibroblast growth factor-binding protein 2 [Silurus meridionalis]
MQSLSCALVLSCCVWAAVAHNQDGEVVAEAGRTKSVLEEPIQFVTKTKDRCSMTLTGHGELTRMRISCVGQEASYWCEYQGKPESCRNYNTNPQHFFKQIMWELRKLKNACQGPKFFKPSICKKASDESQMIIISGSSSTMVRKPAQAQTTTAKQEQAKPEAPTTAPHSDQAKSEQKPNRQKPKQKHVKPQPTRPSPARPGKAKTEHVKPVASKPGSKTTQQKKVLAPKAPTQAPASTTPAPTRSAETLAQQYCWHSMQDFCTKVISWFTK